MYKKCPKGPKMLIHNIAVSHLFTPAVVRVFTVQCKIWTKVVFVHRPHKKKKTTLLNDNELGIQNQKPVEARLTTPWFFYVDRFFMSFILFGDIL